MDWCQFIMNLESLHHTQVEDLLEKHGALAVTLSDAGDDPVLEPAPGETPLWGDTQICGLFKADASFDLLKQDILRSFDLVQLPEHRVEHLKDRAWEREWLKDFAPMKFGRRLWVSPHDVEGAFGDDVVIRLDPGLAFGTGTHPTTALCLEWLDGTPLKHKRVMDFGCGSGILAIGALLLGADSVTAMDIDPQAITSTRRNAESNGVDDRLTTTMSADGGNEKFDVVVANILAGPLIELAPLLSTILANHGLLALSGILESQIGSVRTAYEPWVCFEAPAIVDGWVLLTGKRR
jgi:ribosomal protein L11 methyltransferase